MEQVQLPKNGRAWWKKLDIDVQPTEAGTRNKDPEAVTIGRAKLRMALGKDDSTLG